MTLRSSKLIPSNQSKLSHYDTYLINCNSGILSAVADDLYFLLK